MTNKSDWDQIVSLQLIKLSDFGPGKMVRNDSEITCKLSVAVHEAISNPDYVGWIITDGGDYYNDHGIKQLAELPDYPGKREG